MPGEPVAHLLRRLLGCLVSQSRIFCDRLLLVGDREGVDFEYVEYGDIGHRSVDIEHKIRPYRLLADFLDRVL